MRRSSLFTVVNPAAGGGRSRKTASAMLDRLKTAGIAIEVAETRGVVPGIKEINVYGVVVPGADGRAGMAALVATLGFDPAALGEKIAGNLAPFARPVFLRLRPEMEITGTFKLKKADLVKDGFDPGRIDDPLYWFDPARLRYEPLTHEVYSDIAAGRVKI